MPLIGPLEALGDNLARPRCCRADHQPAMKAGSQIVGMPFQDSRVGKRRCLVGFLAGQRVSCPDGAEDGGGAAAEPAPERDVGFYGDARPAQEFGLVSPELAQYVVDQVVLI